MSYQNLILITNCSNNTQSIFTTETNIELGFIKCIEWLQNEYIKDKQIKYIVTDNSCEIFTEQEIVKEGWVWNVSNVKKEVLYTLSLIKVECPVLKPLKKSTESQTDTVTKVNFSMNTPSTKNLYTEKEQNSYCLELEVEDCDYCDNYKVEPLVKNFKRLSLNNLDLGTGYANHAFTPLWNSIQQELQNELKEKLALDNLGLKNTKDTQNILPKIKLE